jgi:replicative DNA helicase
MTIECEKALLGALLLNSELFNSALPEYLTADCFKEKHHQIIFELMDNAMVDYSAFDIPILLSLINKEQELEIRKSSTWASSVEEYLLTLANENPGQRNANLYALIICQNFKSRKPSTKIAKIYGDSHATS